MDEAGFDEHRQATLPDEPDGDPVLAVRACLDCGDPDADEAGCAHGSVARFFAASSPVREAIVRLRRATAEQRAAARALQVVLLAECARGGAEIEEPPHAAAAAVIVPCPTRAGLENEPSVPAPVRPDSRRRRRTASAAQQSFAFAHGVPPERQV